MMCIFNGSRPLLKKSLFSINDFLLHSFHSLAYHLLTPRSLSRSKYSLGCHFWILSHSWSTTNQNISRDPFQHFQLAFKICDNSDISLHLLIISRNLLNQDNLVYLFLHLKNFSLFILTLSKTAKTGTADKKSAGEIRDIRTQSHQNS